MKAKTVRVVLWMSVLFALASGPLMMYLGLLHPNSLMRLEPCGLSGPADLEKDMHLFSIDRRGILTQAIKISQDLIYNVDREVQKLKEIELVTAADRVAYEATLDAVKATIDNYAKTQEDKLDDLIKGSMVWVQARKGCWVLTKGDTKK
jgi:hypothetical protein